MAQATPAFVSMEMEAHSTGVLLRTIVIGLTAFLTVVDLFATQAILPTLTRAYGITPAAMGVAVNSSTMGMAIARLIVGWPACVGGIAPALGAAALLAFRLVMSSGWRQLDSDK